MSDDWGMRMGTHMRKNWSVSYLTEPLELAELLHWAVKASPAASAHSFSILLFAFIDPPSVRLRSRLPFLASSAPSRPARSSKSDAHNPQWTS